MRVKAKQMKLKLLYLLLIAGIILYWLFPTAENQVERKINQLASLTSHSSQIHPITKLQRAKQAAALFTENISFQLYSGRYAKDKVLGKENLIKEIILAQGYFDQLEIILNIKELKITGDQAIVQVEGIAKGQVRGQAESFYETQLLTLKFIETGGWLLTEIIGERQN